MGAEMIDHDDPDIAVAMFGRAQHLARLDEQRLEHELRSIHTRAAAAFVERGDDELSAWFRAEEIVARLRAFVANRRRARAGGGEQNPAEGDAAPARG